MGPLLLATGGGDGGEFHLLDRPGHAPRQRRCSRCRVARATVSAYRLGNTCPAVQVPEMCRGGSLNVPAVGSCRRIGERGQLKGHDQLVERMGPLLLATGGGEGGEQKRSHSSKELIMAFE